MFCLNETSARNFRALICLPLLIGIWAAMTPPAALHISQAWPDGPVTLVVEQQSNDYSLNSIEEHHGVSAERVIINESTHEQLMTCPGIGSKTAALIVKERSFARFHDWRDLHDRVKGMSHMKIEKLQEAGVRLNREEQIEEGR